MFFGAKSAESMLGKLSFNLKLKNASIVKFGSKLMNIVKSKFIQNLAIFTAVCAGIALPLRAAGVAVEQGALVLALVGALVILTQDKNTRMLVREGLTSKTGALITSVFVIWCSIVWFSYYPLGSLKTGTRTGLLVLGSVCVWAVLSEHKQARVWGVRAFLLVFVVTSLIVVGSLNGFNIFSIERPALAFKAYAAVAMCLIPMSIVMGRKASGIWKVIGYSNVPLALLVALDTDNRAALAGLFAMSLLVSMVLGVSKSKHRKRVFYLVVVAFVGLIIFLQFINARGNTGLHIFAPEWLVDSHRQYIWRFSLELFLEHPWVGNGIDQLNYLPGADKQIEGLSKGALLVPSHPHNWIVELLSETGIIGFLPVIVTLIYISWRWFRCFLMTKSEYALAVLALMAGFFGSGLFNFSIWAVWWQLTFYISYAFLAASEHAVNQEVNID